MQKCKTSSAADTARVSKTSLRERPSISLGHHNLFLACAGPVLEIWASPFKNADGGSDVSSITDELRAVSYYDRVPFGSMLYLYLNDNLLTGECSKMPDPNVRHAALPV